MLTVNEAARALLDAFGGDTPDWLREEAQALEEALERAETIAMHPVAPLPLFSGKKRAAAGLDAGPMDLMSRLDRS